MTGCSVLTGSRSCDGANNERFEFAFRDFRVRFEGENITDSTRCKEIRHAGFRVRFEFTGGK